MNFIPVQMTIDAETCYIHDKKFASLIARERT